MANRHLLAVNKLENFKQWLIEDGWQIENTKGVYEVLRARKDTERFPLIVYKRDKDGLVHLSVSNYNERFVCQYLKNRYKSKDKWQKLKEWILDIWKQDLSKELSNGSKYSTKHLIHPEKLLYKMQELEGEDE